MDINQEVEILIEKYSIDRHYPAYRASRRACDYIQTWVQKLDADGEESLFIGMDEQALRLIKGWGAGDSINVLLIKSVDELESHTEELGAKQLYVVSYTNTIEILHWLWRNHYQAVSVYDVLENEQIYLQMEFYRFFTPIKPTKELDLYRWIVDENTPDGSSIVLLEYHYQKRRLEYIADERDVKRIHEKLFFLSILMRNFIEAERILGIMEGKSEFVQFWNEVCKLLSKIKEELNSRQQRDIVIYWLDAVPYNSVKELKYLGERQEHSLCFHNAYTVTPWTLSTGMTIFCNIREVDDLGYHVNHINLQNSPVLRDIEEQGCAFNVLSADFCGMFDKEYSHSILKWSDTCSEVFWNLVVQILQSNQRTVYFVHTGMETHEPVLSVRKKRFDMKHNNEVQLEELDAQLRFYDEMLGSGFYRIYMSDHGYCTMAPVNRTHILFQVYCSDWKKKDNNKIFSLLDFNKILHQLLIREEIEDCLWEREYAPIQSIDIYNRMLLQGIISRKGSLANYIAYKGLITEEYLYVYYKMGEEVLIKLSDMEKGSAIVLYAEKTQEELEQCRALRERVGEFPKELDTDPKFEYSRYLYRVYINLKKTVRVFAQLLNEKLSEYPDNGVALRMGGDHSYQLYALLSGEAKKKICCVIDKDMNCKCKDLGIPVISDMANLPDDVRAVILSSYMHLNALKEEAQKYRTSLEVIDVYDYMREHGYEFHSVFWWGIDQDWDVGFPMS